MEITAGAGTGVLIAVLWFDLMFDIQVRGTPRDVVPTEILDSIAGYYRRVTTESRPMNRLVAVAMLTALVTLISSVVSTPIGRELGIVAAVALGAAIALAGVRTVRNAVRLGSQADVHAVQSRLAHAIFRDHLTCLACVGTSLFLQIAR